MFQRLLVAIDDSEQREITLSFALALARQCGSTVHLCFVNAVPMGGRGIPLLIDAEANDVVAAPCGSSGRGDPRQGSVRRTLSHRVAQGLVSSAASCRPTPSSSDPDVAAGSTGCSPRGCGNGPSG